RCKSPILRAADRAEAARKKRELSADLLPPVDRRPGARLDGPPAEVRGHRVEAVRDIVELDHIDLVRRDDRVPEKDFHGGRARYQQPARQLELGFLDAASLKEPVEHI